MCVCVCVKWKRKGVEKQYAIPLIRLILPSSRRRIGFKVFTMGHSNTTTPPLNMYHKQTNTQRSTIYLLLQNDCSQSLKQNEVPPLGGAPRLRILKESPSSIPTCLKLGKVTVRNRSTERSRLSLLFVIPVNVALSGSFPRGAKHARTSKK